MKSTRADTTSHDVVLRLLELIGHSLTSLRIKIPNIDETLATRMLATCPNLTHLTLSNVTLSSMKFIDDAYARGMSLSSLALKQWRLPTEELEAFLKKLLDKDSMVCKTLRRLRIGKYWPTQFPESTFELMRNILKTNLHLTHFAYYSSDADESDEAVMDEFNGGPVKGQGTALSRATRLAFLDGVYFVAKKNPHLALTDHLKANILEFASNVKLREILCWKIRSWVVVIRWLDFTNGNKILSTRTKKYFLHNVRSIHFL